MKIIVGFIFGLAATAGAQFISSTGTGYTVRWTGHSLPAGKIIVVTVDGQSVISWGVSAGQIADASVVLTTNSKDAPPAEETPAP